MKKVKRYAGMQESQVSLNDGENAPIAIANTGDGNPLVGGLASGQVFNKTGLASGQDLGTSTPAFNSEISPERRNFDADLYRSFSREFGPAPQDARNRLDARGVDVEALMKRTGRKNGGVIKKMASGGMTSKVSNASKRGDGIAQRGKTKGRYL
jgi:hypothetical protein